MTKSMCKCHRQLIAPGDPTVLGKRAYCWGNTMEPEGGDSLPAFPVLDSSESAEHRILRNQGQGSKGRWVSGLLASQLCDFFRLLT